MRLLANCFLLVALSCPIFGDVIGFYTGDFEPTNGNANALANERTGLVSAASTYQSFVVPTGGWTITRLFTNNLLDFRLVSAYWEIRSGVSVGNGGTLLYSGTDSSATAVATGRQAFGLQESTVTVSGLSISLAPGTYWMAVTPENTGVTTRSYHSNTFGLNAVGSIPQNVAYFNSSFFGSNFDNANSYGVFPALSGGAYISSASVPEPVEVSLLVLGTGGLIGIARRRRS